MAEILKQYKAKRSFDKTPEPAGEQRGGRSHASILPVPMNLRASPGSTSENRPREEPA